jgi:hypothetical protein
VLVAARAILKGPTKSRPHMAKGQDGGIVLRAWAGTCCCLAKNWQPLHHRTRSWASARAVGQ